ncbi:MAG: MIP/aquaporin family protein [Bacteroidota bacterium]|nr:MIP/aquaporin family protein [Bacteroidota bacterium]|tara:strand:+ start:2034 stop:2663 length:630 start_codon:yes stop_codon:yes gene_type:complete
MKKYIVEGIGTYFLVLIIGLTGNPIAIGIGLSILVYMGGHISGAHYNPAVSLAMIIRGEISVGECLKYVLSQCIGAVAAAYSIILLGADALAVVSKTDSMTSFFLAEIIFTFLLVFVILNVATHPDTKNNQYYGLAIGLTVAAGAFSVGEISGGVFNPAVSFGPSVLSIIDPDIEFANIVSHNFFIYYLGATVIGSVIASLLFNFLLKK